MSMNRQPPVSRLLLLPLTLIVAGVVLAVGCIPMPMVPKRVSGSSAADFVGSETSSKPVRPGSITREQVIALVGAPEPALSNDGRTLIYRWQEQTGTWLFCSPRWLEGSGSYEWYRTRQLVLSFDDAGVLRGYHFQTVKE